jgi:hypothetical protein
MIFNNGKQNRDKAKQPKPNKEAPVLNNFIEPGKPACGHYLCSALSFAMIIKMPRAQPITTIQLLMVATISISSLHGLKNLGGGPQAAPAGRPENYQ